MAGSRRSYPRKNKKLLQLRSGRFVLSPAVLMLDGTYGRSSSPHRVSSTAFSCVKDIGASSGCECLLSGSLAARLARRGHKRKTMGRSFIITSVFAATAALGACSNNPSNNTVPNKPVTTSPSPISTASPAASPVASPSTSPVASPGKPGATPVGGNVNTKATPEKKAAETPKK